MDWGEKEETSFVIAMRAGTGRIEQSALTSVFRNQTCKNYQVYKSSYLLAIIY